MRDLISSLALSLRAAHRTRYEYTSMLDVAAGQNALRSGQLTLARQYFERAVPVFEKLAKDSEDNDAALCDLMSTNACLIDTLQRLIESREIIDADFQLELTRAQALQSEASRKLATRATAGGRLVAAKNA
jgi:hypothetical protein